jgi:hypothetical protein
MQRQSRVMGLDELAHVVRGAGEQSLDEATRRSIERSLMAAHVRDPGDKRAGEIERQWIALRHRSSPLRTV